MEDLEALPVNQVLLKKNPDIVKTIKMLRKYKGSERIKQKAEVIYHKFKAFFLSGEGDFGTPTTPVIKTQHLPLSSLCVNQHLQLYCGIMNLTGDHNSCFLSSTGIYQLRQSYRQASLILVLVLRITSGTQPNIY